MPQGYSGSYADLIQVIQAKLGNTPTRLPYTPNWEGVRKAILDSSGGGTPRAGDPPDAIQGVIEAIVDKFGVSGTQNLTNIYPPSPRGILEAFRQTLNLGAGGENPSLEGIITLLLNASSGPTNLTTNLTGSTGNWSIQVSWNAPGTGTVVNYTVQLSSDGGSSWGSTQTVTPPTTTYTYTALANGSYLVRVRANFASSSSAYVTSSSIVAGAGVIPVLIWGAL